MAARACRGASGEGAGGDKPSVRWTSCVTAHRRCMTASIALASVPLWQRIASWVALAPLAMVLRCLVCSVRDAVPPWGARWGPPGSPVSLLLGRSIADGEMLADPRAAPLIVSIDGYGEAESASFAASAWVGLAVALHSAWRLQQPGAAMVVVELRAADAPSKLCGRTCGGRVVTVQFGCIIIGIPRVRGGHGAARARRHPGGFGWRCAAGGGVPSLRHPRVHLRLPRRWHRRDRAAGAPARRRLAIAQSRGPRLRSPEHLVLEDSRE